MLASSRPCHSLRSTSKRSPLVAPGRTSVVPVRAVLAEGPPSSSGASASTRELLALKEWNVTCAALGDGTQTVLFRKGGIAEGPFKTRAKEFLLFPTKFHTEEKLLQPQAAQDYAAIMDFAPGDQLEFSVIAKVTGCWTTFDPTVVEKTASLHIWNEKFLDSRLKWRPKVPITVLELRTYRLAPPARTPSQKEYFGCFSWVELQDAMPDVASRWAEVQPVLSEEAFAARQRALRAVLEGMEVEALSVDDH